MNKNISRLIAFFILTTGLLSAEVGKTHFIVSAPTKAVVPSPVPLPACSCTADVMVLFSPPDDLRHHLLTRIAAEKRAISIAVFMLTDADIAQALMAAVTRGVQVEIITDIGCLKDRSSKIAQLHKSGCVISIYNPTAGAKGVGLMHHKFAIFMQNSNGPCVWTGSCNFTKAAQNNRENVVIFSDKKIADTFLHHFVQLKRHSYRYAHDKLAVS